MRIFQLAIAAEVKRLRGAAPRTFQSQAGSIGHAMAKDTELDRGSFDGGHAAAIQLNRYGPRETQFYLITPCRLDQRLALFADRKLDLFAHGHFSSAGKRQADRILPPHGSPVLRGRTQTRL